MQNLLGFFLLSTVYGIIFNLGISIPALLFGVRVEKFAICSDPWFRLLAFQVKHTKYILGWVPLGSYVKLSGMINEDSEEVLPFHFTTKSPLNQLLIVTGGPMTIILLLLTVHMALFEHQELKLNPLIFQLVVILISPFLLFGAAIRLNKKRELKSTSKTTYYFLALMVYCTTLFAFGRSINEVIPFFDSGKALLEGKMSFSSLFAGDSRNVLAVSENFGLLLAFWQLLPLAGMSGFSALNVIYKTLSGEEVPAKVAAPYAIISLLFILCVYGWVIYKLF